MVITKFLDQVMGFANTKAMNYRDQSIRVMTSKGGVYFDGVLILYCK